MIGFPRVFAKVLNETVHQDGDVLLALAQRRQVNGDHVDTKKQVLPELSAGDHLGQVFVGGGDDPHIDPHRTVIADPVELPGFQDPQQLDLHGQRHVADLVQKDVPAGGFTTAFLTHIVGRHYYEPVVRPALLTAVLGYTFVVIGLLVDIGRSWAIWKPMVFWNFNSVLFEVAMCVMFYLNVLYRWDWSKAGDQARKPIKDKYGMGDYDPKKGEFAWRESAKPSTAGTADSTGASCWATASTWRRR